MARIFKKGKCVDENVKKLECTLLVGMKNGEATVGRVLKIKELPYGPGIPLLGNIPIIIETRDSDTCMPVLINFGKSSAMLVQLYLLLALFSP